MDCRDAHRSTFIWLPPSPENKACCSLLLFRPHGHSSHWPRTEYGRWFWKMWLLSVGGCGDPRQASHLPPSAAKWSSLNPHSEHIMIMLKMIQWLLISLGMNPKLLPWPTCKSYLILVLPTPSISFISASLSLMTHQPDWFSSCFFHTLPQSSHPYSSLSWISLSLMCPCHLSLHSNYRRPPSWPSLSFPSVQVATCPFLFV